VSYTTVAHVTELNEDKPLAVDVNDDLSVALVLHHGRVYAIEDECSHGKVKLSDGDVEDSTIECYLHGSTFDLETGRPLNLPATTSVRVFPCRIEGEDVQIDVTTPTTDY